MRFWFSLLLLLSGCTVGPDFVRPKAPNVPPFSTQSKIFDPSYSVPQKWWQLFQSSEADLFITKALDANAQLESALATLKQTKALFEAGAGIQYPQIDAQAEATRQKTNPRAFGVRAPENIFNLFTLSTSVYYTLDLFGENRRSIEALGAQVDAQQSLVQATYLTLTANSMNALIDYASTQAQISDTERLIQIQKQQLAVTQAQYDAGRIPYVNVASIQSQLYTVEATLPSLKQKLYQTKHLLAVLSGTVPQSFEMPKVSLTGFKLPGRLPKTLPSELVRQRPDILQAEAELHVASAQVGIATAALYPSLSLTGTISTNASNAGDLFSKNSSIWNIGANLTAPLFHGGTLRAEKKAAVHAFNASLATYRQTVLSAFSQVADTLRALETDAERVQIQSEALRSADESLRLIQVNYRAGTANYLQVLIANTQYHQALIAHEQAAAQRLQDTVALFTALGGGWWLEANVNR